MAKHHRRTSGRSAHRDVPRPKPQRYTYKEAMAVVAEEDLHVTEVVRVADGGLRIQVVETDKQAKARTLFVVPEPGQSSVA